LTQYRLHSMFALNKDDTLLFQMGLNGAMQLLETPFSQQLDLPIHTFLQKCNSIPAFLSSITTDLFNAQTYAPQQL